MAHQPTDSQATTKRKQNALEEALNYLAKDDIKTTLKDNLPLRFHLDTVTQHAEEFGLSPIHIHNLLLLACGPKFGQSVKSQLVHALIPNDQVWSKSVLHLMSTCCTGRLSYTCMALLFRWLILVYDFIDDIDALHSMYDVIFHFIESENMFPYVCHLLYLLTRREDVTLHRVRALLSLQQRKGTERPLLGLLSVYKVYCPHLISISVPKTTKNFFKNLDRAWSLKIKKVQQLSTTEGNTEVSAAELSVPSHLVTKRPKKTLLPDLQPTTLVSEVRLSEVDRRSSKSLVTVPFTEVKSFRQLVDNLHRVELPSQLAAALGNKNLQHLVLCHPDRSVSLRIEYWLEQTLTEEFFMDTSDKLQAERLLYLLIHLSDFLQEGVPVVEHFLSRYLHLWDGTEFRRYILQLVTRYRLRRFDVMYDLLLEPLRKLFFCSSVYFKCEVLACFTKLLSNLVLVEWPRYKYTAQHQRDNTSDIATTVCVYSSQHDSYSVFTEEVECFSGLQTIIEFIQFTDSLCSLGLEAESDHCLLSHCVLSFYKLVSTLYTDHAVPVVELCGRGILYKHLFSNNAMLLSRFCDIMNSYRVSFSSLRQASVSGWTEEHHAARSQQIAHIPLFNGYVLDFCDSLWRNKAFSGTEPLTIFKLLKDTQALEKIRSASKSAHSAFALHCHPALLGHVMCYQREMKFTDLRLHPLQLKHEKEEFLEYLSDHSHLTGIHGFIRTFIKSRSGGSNTSGRLSMMSTSTS